MIFTTTLLASCVKLLLIPAYRSTDFEVHRNWLAITHSLPVKKWYFENTSEWTLDYPPLFGYFEYILSIFASLFDKNMLIVENLNYVSRETLLFQRLSVIVVDLIYAYGVYKCSSSILQKSWKTEVVLPVLLVVNCGLIIVDHIHFQYNGIMYGILLLSVSFMFQGKHVLSAFWFTILLNMKHINIYLAPAYFIYLLRYFCLKNSTNLKGILSKSFLRNITVLGSVVIGVFTFTFFPFYDHLPQVFSRMFPFKRGLCHAYWAPNFWAIYNTVDKISARLLSNVGFQLKTNETASMTGGLVQEFPHAILPNITPLITMIITAISMIPAVLKLWTLNKDPLHFVRCLVLCSLCSFIFGWHVHEKAILMAIIPLSILSVVDSVDANVFLLLCTIGHYSLFPLLYPKSLLIIKVLLLILYSIYAFHSLSKIYPLSIYKFSFPLLNIFESLYLTGLVLLFLYDNVIHILLDLQNSLPYLPLMITSLYCSLGIIYCWLKYYVYFLRKRGGALKKHANR